MAACVRSSHMVLERSNKMSVETIVKKEEKPAVEEMMQFIRSLSEEEQREVSSLMRGVAFGVKLARSSESKKVKMAAGM